MVNCHNLSTCACDCFEALGPILDQTDSLGALLTLLLPFFLDTRILEALITVKRVTY
jgi:hypothetical protein